MNKLLTKINNILSNPSEIQFLYYQAYLTVEK